MIDWYDKIFNIVTECEEYLDEAVRKKVIRKGKIKKKLFCQPGMKAVGRRCKKMGSDERRSRRRALKVAARKAKSKMTRIMKKRKKAMKKRRAAGLS